MLSRVEVEVLILEGLADVRLAESALYRRFRSLAPNRKNRWGQFVWSLAALDARVLQLERLVSLLDRAGYTTDPVAA